MSVPCNPSPGTYTIYASDDTGVNTCLSGVCGEVVVLHNVKADVTLTLDVAEPDCYYQMQVKCGYIGPCAGQSLLGSYKDPSGYWVITFHPDLNGFTILFNGDSSLAWTDPGGAPGCDRQIALTPLTSPIHYTQLFKFG